jgi:hypothetical protein
MLLPGRNAGLRSASERAEKLTANAEVPARNSLLVDFTFEVLRDPPKYSHGLAQFRTDRRLLCVWSYYDWSCGLSRVLTASLGSAPLKV